MEGSTSSGKIRSGRKGGIKKDEKKQGEGEDWGSLDMHRMNRGRMSTFTSKRKECRKKRGGESGKVLKRGWGENQDGHRL